MKNYWNYRHNHSGCMARPASSHITRLPGRQQEIKQMKKRFLKTKPVCKVTFELPKEVTREAHTVALVGEFNSWDTTSTLMRRRKDGSFSITLDLPAHREYQFKYLIDDDYWENDWQADKYFPNNIGDSDNSIVVV